MSNNNINTKIRSQKKKKEKKRIKDRQTNRQTANAIDWSDRQQMPLFGQQKESLAPFTVE